MKHISQLVIGASVLGSGAAVAAEKDSAVIEPGIVPGSEFVQAFRHRKANTPSGASAILYNDMKKRNLISEDGRMHLFPVSGILASYLKASGACVRFASTVFEIKPSGGGYIVSFCGESGIEHIFAENLLDTTPLGVLHGGAKGMCIQKSLCAMLAGEGGGDSENITFRSGRFEGETVMELKLPFSCDISEGRRLMAEEWQKLKLPNTRLAAVAEEFCYDFERPVRLEISPHRIWMPSASYGDLFTAFEEGHQCISAI